MKLVVKKDGSIDKVEVVRGLGYGLDESAVATVKKKWSSGPPPSTDNQ